MEALQLLVDMVKDLPDLAIWVIIAFFAYKTIIVGSIYGVVKYVAKVIHDICVARKTQVVEKEIRATLDGMTITGHLPALIAQIDRLKGARSKGGACYIHNSDVEFLRDAIDAQIEKDRECGEP